MLQKLESDNEEINLLSERHRLASSDIFMMFNEMESVENASGEPGIR
jgi:hypothetical protein